MTVTTENQKPALTNAQRQKAYRARYTLMRDALREIDERLSASDKPLAVKLRAIAREALGEQEGKA